MERPRNKDDCYKYMCSTWIDIKFRGIVSVVITRVADPDVAYGQAWE